MFWFILGFEGKDHMRKKWQSQGGFYISGGDGNDRGESHRREERKGQSGNGISRTPDQMNQLATQFRILLRKENFR